MVQLIAFFRALKSQDFVFNRSQTCDPFSLRASALAILEPN